MKRKFERKSKVPSSVAPVVHEHVKKANKDGQCLTWETLTTFINDHSNDVFNTKTVTRFLKSHGFKKGKGIRKIEITDFIKAMRDHFIDRMRRNLHTRKENTRLEVYLDESYVNVNHARQEIIYHADEGPYTNKPAGVGDRFIIIGAGSKMGGLKDLFKYGSPQTKPVVITEILMAIFS